MMDRFLLFLCMTFVLIGCAIGGSDYNDNTTQAQAACTALLNQCTLECGSHDGINTETSDCVISNNGSVNLDCVCSDGYVAPNSSSLAPQVTFFAIAAAAAATLFS